VSNLPSNALEHTFSGEIAVELRHRTYHADLIVRDTGIGIAEGSGIRLCVVQEPGRCPQVRAARCTAMTGRSAATWA
jgi:anti-sigma regulatory factor (Ser/Thr protein kinase)